MMQQIKNIIFGFEGVLDILPSLTFNFFLIIKYAILFTALMAVMSVNPVHSVLYLIITFVLSSTLIITLGAEFLGVLLIIVYVGAIAVLFLFIVMMLNVEEQKKISFNMVIYLCSSMLVSVLLASTLTKFIYDFIAIKQSGLLLIYTLPFSNQFVYWINIINIRDNVAAIGMVLYTYYFQLLFLSGFVLLLAMIASISLALMPPEFALLRTKHQDKYEQLSRTLNKSVSISTWSK